MSATLLLHTVCRPRYKLLLTELLKYTTDEHPDYAMLTLALQHVSLPASSPPPCVSPLRLLGHILSPAPHHSPALNGWFGAGRCQPLSSMSMMPSPVAKVYILLFGGLLSSRPEQHFSLALSYTNATHTSYQLLRRRDKLKR